MQPCTRDHTKENNTETDLRLLVLGGQAVKNLRSLACKFELDQSERKSSQAFASTRKSWLNGVASYRKFSTCDNLRLRLARALNGGQKKPITLGWKNRPCRPLHKETRRRIIDRYLNAAAKFVIFCVLAKNGQIARSTIFRVHLRFFRSSVLR